MLDKRFFAAAAAGALAWVIADLSSGLVRGWINRRKPNLLG